VAGPIPAPPSVSALEWRRATVPLGPGPFPRGDNWCVYSAAGALARTPATNPVTYSPWPIRSPARCCS